MLTLKNVSVVDVFGTDVGVDGVCFTDEMPVTIYKNTTVVSRLWRTKDGRTLRPADMTTTHLYNTISLLERNFQHWKTSPPPVPDDASPEEANEHWERYVRPRITMTITEKFPIYVDLWDELTKRSRACDCS